MVSNDNSRCSFTQSLTNVEVDKRLRFIGAIETICGINRVMKQKMDFPFFYIDIPDSYRTPLHRYEITASKIADLKSFKAQAHGKFNELMEKLSMIKMSDEDFRKYFYVTGDMNRTIQCLVEHQKLDIMCAWRISHNRLDMAVRNMVCAMYPPLVRSVPDDSYDFNAGLVFVLDVGDKCNPIVIHNCEGILAIPNSDIESHDQKESEN